MSRSLRVLYIVFAILCLASAARADEGERPIPNFNAAAKDESAPGKDAVAEAVHDLRHKAARGDADAQEQLAEHYEDGDGVKQDFTKAGAWYERAANQGNAKAQNKLGYLYMRGLGMSQNFTEAYFWISISASPVDARTQAIRDEIRKALAPEKVSGVQKRIAEWAPEIEEVDPLDIADDEDADAEDVADENLCKGFDIAGRTAPLPRRSQRPCRKAYGEMREACFNITSCADCEAALKSFIVACRKTTSDTEIDPAFRCDEDSDCHLIETSYCEVEYQPLSVNSQHLQAVRKARAIPVIDCPRPRELKDKYRAICTEHMCKVKKSE